MEQLHRALELSDENTDYYKFGDLQMALGYIHKLRGELEGSPQGHHQGGQLLPGRWTPAAIDVYVNLAVIYRAGVNQGTWRRDWTASKRRRRWPKSTAPTRTGPTSTRSTAGCRLAETIAGPSPLTRRPWSIKGSRPGGLSSIWPWPPPTKALATGRRRLGTWGGKLGPRNPPGREKDLAELYSDLGLFYQELGDVERLISTSPGPSNFTGRSGSGERPPRR